MLNINDDIKIGVIGLGYVGLPLACLFANNYHTVGYDINKQKVADLQQGNNTEDPSVNEQLGLALQGKLTITTDSSKLKSCNLYVVAVPTPVNKDNEPNIGYLLNATRSVGALLSKGNVVVYESTVYPGLTEDVCAPLLETTSKLKLNKDFYVGFSPERINPSDPLHTVENIRKVTSGSTPEAAEFIDQIYNSVLKNGTFKAKSIRIAEACKIMENCQRDVLIAFFNEFRMVFNNMGIDVNDVSQAASTKWNFIEAKPGLVGGHCIAVDPYYMISKSQQVGIVPQLLQTARKINEGMAHWLADNVEQWFTERNLRKVQGRILILGFSFKPDCSDIRNTKVADLYNDLNRRGFHASVYDPLVNTDEVMEKYGIHVCSDPSPLNGKYQAVVIGTHHTAFSKLNFDKLIEKNGFVCDINGLVKGK